QVDALIKAGRVTPAQGKAIFSRAAATLRKRLASSLGRAERRMVGRLGTRGWSRKAAGAFERFERSAKGFAKAATAVKGFDVLYDVYELYEAARSPDPVNKVYRVLRDKGIEWGAGKATTMAVAAVGAALGMSAPLVVAAGIVAGITTEFIVSTGAE